MKVLVCGATGCVGSAVVQALRSRGHHVVEASRRSDWPIDFMHRTTPHAWAARLQPLQLDAVVNCVGILMERGGQRFAHVHAQGPIELFRGAALAGIGRVVQVSALGGSDIAYLRSKREADTALLAMPAATLAGAVLRPSLVYGPGSESGALFATLAALPVVSLPGGGRQRLAPLHVYELAECIALALERREPLRGVFELGGADTLDYRTMLQTYRDAMALGPALWLPLPLALMKLSALAAEALPQRVFCRDTVTLLEAGSVPAHNAAPALLGRAPSTLAAGLAITPPAPWLTLRATLSPPLARAMRFAIAFLWLYTALISAASPQGSGVLDLLARCGFDGRVGVVVLAASCTLNLALGIGLLRRPAPWFYPLQIAAVIGYTTMAAWHMPALLFDHCGPLVKNLPLLAALLVLWLDAPAPPSTRRRGRSRPLASVASAG